MENINVVRLWIGEGIKIITQMQNLNKIADSSTLSWRVVAEYQANPIADDSKNKKRIIKAKYKGERKEKQQQVIRKPSSFASRSHPS